MKIRSIVSAGVLFLTIITFFIIFNYSNQAGDVVKVISICESECKAQLNDGVNLTAGPCLLNPIPNYPDWVCDVSHWPRLNTDALCQNQCSDYIRYKEQCPNSTTVGTAHHFIEVDPNCTFIRTSP